MAERRMFAKAIIDSDAFLDMPLSSQALYFHLSMRADDDGFVGNPKKIQRMTGCNQDDLAVLISKDFILPFDSGVIVIKHWRVHNCIQKDRYKPTIYQGEKALLYTENNNIYCADNTMETDCIQNVSTMETQVRLGKVSIGKVSIENGTKTQKRFRPPTLEEVKAYCLERNNSINPEKFFNYYEANGWKVGRGKMKDWKAAVRSWESNGYNDNAGNKGNSSRKYCTENDKPTDFNKLYSEVLNNE